MQDLLLRTTTKFCLCVLPEKCWKKYCQLYRKADYDLSNLIVSWCLANVRDCEDKEKYIYLSCHNRLQETNNNSIVFPYYGRCPNVKAGANFLKSLQEMPQFVCTCCHHILSHKTVKPFKIGEYDMNNDIVQKCLSHCYKMTLQKSIPCKTHVKTVNNEWPTVEDRISETHNVYAMSEFICIGCRNSLWQKKPKMPDQACENGLNMICHKSWTA